METVLEKLPTSLSDKTNCFHCGSSVEKNDSFVLTLNGTTHQYCCNGCRQVSKFILESGLETFYDFKGSITFEKVDNVSLEDYELEYWNDSVTLEEFTKSVEPNLREMKFTISNIHCSACVWLNEETLKKQKGIHSARINFATGQAKVVFDPSLIQIGDIFKLVKSIGYLPRLSKDTKSEPADNYAKDLLKRMGVAAFAFGNMMVFGVSLYSGYFQGIELEFKRMFHYFSWFFASIAYFYSGVPFLKGAYHSLKQKRLSMDFLLVTGISLAYVYSIFVTFTDRGEVYFDSVAMIYFFVLLGKYLEERSRVLARTKINALFSEIPDLASIFQNGEWKKIKTSLLKKGDRIQIFPGERIPVDGSLASFHALLDESFRTGESESVEKSKGQVLSSGSIVLSYAIEMIVTKKESESFLFKLKESVEQAILEKPNIERLTDKISHGFISVIFLVAITTFLVWFFKTNALELSLVNTIAVLIVACPCALGLSVPTAYVSNHITNALSGILMKRSDSISILKNIDTVVFDKTGTLTEPTIQFKEILCLPESKDLWIYLAFLVEEKSTHPLAKAFPRPKFQFIDWKLLRTEEIPGKGMIGYFSHKNEKHIIKLGNSKLVKYFSSDSNHSQFSTASLSLDGEPKADFFFESAVRTSSKPGISRLKRMGLQTIILSGDKKQAVELVANNLGVEDFYFEKSPSEKWEILKSLKKSGKHVAYVGDGLNDAPSIASADIGFSMASSVEISLDKSDIVLVQNSIDSIGQSILSAKRTHRIVLQNIIISLLYNSVMIPLAAFGFMAPVICAGFMATSSICVVGNSLRLLKKTK